MKSSLDRTRLHRLSGQITSPNLLFRATMAATPWLKLPYLGIVLSLITIALDLSIWSVCHAWRIPHDRLDVLKLYCLTIPSIISFDLFSCFLPPFHIIRQNRFVFFMCALSSIMVSFFLSILPLTLRIICLNYGITIILHPILCDTITSGEKAAFLLSSLPEAITLLTQIKRIVCSKLTPLTFIPCVALPLYALVVNGYLLHINNESNPSDPRSLESLDLLNQSAEIQIPDGQIGHINGSKQALSRR
ncbi:MAG: hypothetical protein CMF46_02005 [Legionellales bacterium]|nr:hypothetical protein [Legionellales bacterium]